MPAENEVAVSENKLVEYCNHLVISEVCGYSEFVPLTAFSSSYVKSGQSIQIQAGIGTFSAASQPRFFIDGKEVMFSSDYVVRYDFTAKGKPGKYKLPIKIVYTKLDGTLASIFRNLEYTIGE